VPGGGPHPGDAEVPGGTCWLGARPGGGFVFDNEQWAHAVELAPFRIARAPVTQGEFRVFVEDGGYEQRALWSAEGWVWRSAAQAHDLVCWPVYWRREPDGGWSRRRYDRWVPLEPHLPVHFVNAHEAEAFCRWAGRRLPSEAEWECAAGPARYPWGDEPPSSAHAELDLCADEPCEVGAHATGDSPHGLRQMLGNVWEWTATPFGPYPGFEPGPYAEYSAPWFGNHRVLRGGAFATRARLLRSTWRNFYTPDRRDVLAGFRTCALD
ncbi:MAG: ergothioneine biosynthesis protein EgtB, partial [Planctomycetes bacterium]|nr:ergothioneine biosynthesis protein EgtB [Planctomycetota bacterium]